MNIKKFLIVLLFSALFIIGINVNTIYATTDLSDQQINNLDEITVDEINEFEEQTLEKKVTEGKTVIKYDVATNTATEIDLEELLKQVAPEKVDATETDGANFVSSLEDIQRKNYRNFLLSTSDGPSITRFTMIGNTLAEPYRYVCCLMFNAKNGTGFLVGKNLLLTAAHCVVNTNGNKFPSWDCYPAYNGQSYNGIHTSCKSYYIPPEYDPNSTSISNRQYDWCLCVLNDNLGTTMGGWMGCQKLVYDSSFTDGNGLQVEEYGYPELVSKPSGVGYQHLAAYTEGNTYSPTTNNFRTTAAAKVGLSGGPVYSLNYEKAIGIVNGSITDENYNTYAVRITKRIIDAINAHQ